MYDTVYIINIYYMPNYIYYICMCILNIWNVYSIYLFIHIYIHTIYNTVYIGNHICTSY